VSPQTEDSPESKILMTLYNVSLLHARYPLLPSLPLLLLFIASPLPPSLPLSCLSLLLECDMPVVNIDSVGYCIGGRSVPLPPPCPLLILSLVGQSDHLSGDAAGRLRRDLCGLQHRHRGTITSPALPPSSPPRPLVDTDARNS
jgi:hypothetical protein